MRYLLRPMLAGISRSKTAHILNFIGLSVAFTCFAVIIMQVRYELSFDQHFRNADKIYQFQAFSPYNGVYGSHHPRPLAEHIGTLSPHIEGSAYAIFPMFNQAVYAVDKGPLTSVEMDMQLVSASLCQVFGVEIVAGSLRDFSAGSKAILSESAAKALFGDESPIGKMIDNFTEPQQREVVAVHKDFPDNSSLINGVLGNLGDLHLGSWWKDWFFMIYLSIPDDRHIPEVEAITGEYYKNRHTKQVFETDQIVRLTQLTDFHFVPMNNTHNQGSKIGTFSLLGVGLLILCIAVINFINFSVATIPLRIRHINTRKVLGVKNSQLRLQQIVESVFMSLLAAGFSLVLISLLAESSFGQLFRADLRLSHNTLPIMVLMAVAVLVGVTASLYPAWYSTSFSPALVLKGSFGLSPKGRKLRTALIGFQYCISITLIVLALYIRYQYQYMRYYDIGIDAQQIATVTLSPKMAEARKSIDAELERNPRILDVTYSNGLVIDHAMTEVWGRQYKGEGITFDAYPVETNFPEFMGLQVVEGGKFTEADKTRTGSAYMFNRAAQHKHELEVGDLLEGTVILGIFEDFNARSLAKEIEPLGLYLLSNSDSWQDRYNLNQLYFKTATADVNAAFRDVRKILLDVDPDAANILKIKFLDEKVEELHVQERDLFRMIFSFSLLAILISTVGAFGLIMFETQYRKKEIAVRKVFGSTMEQVLLLFNKRYVWLVLICYAISIPIAWYLVVEWQRPYAYKAPFSVWIFLASLLIVMLITIATVTLQSYRTATANPIQALRGE